MSQSFTDLLEKSRHSYLHFHNKPYRNSPYHHLALVDFQVRLLTSLLACRLRDLGRGNTIRLGKAPGFATWISHLDRLTKHLSDVRELDVRLAFAGKRLVENLKAKPCPREANFDTITKLRNHLAHGTPLPSDELGLEIEAFCQKLTRRIHNDFVVLARDWHWQPEPTHSITTPCSSSIETSLGTINPWPLVGITKDGLELFSRMSSRSITYHTPDPKKPLLVVRNDEAHHELRKHFLNPHTGDPESSSMASRVLADLAGFSEQDAHAHLLETNDGFGVAWTLETSDGTDERVDCFRIGTDNIWQWWNRKQWRNYSDFLREVSNWPMLARRLRQRMDRILAVRQEREQEFLPPIANGDPSLFIQPLIEREERDLERRKPGHPEDLDHLEREVDYSLESNRGSTNVYFIVGEAGIGKTRALEHLAHKRAADVESQPSTRKALFLFVASTGNPLANLDDIVQAAVGATKLLTTEAVQALCRNGLMVLVIDGFDELLGGVTYKDALGSLRPWIEDVGGRGVLVVSARSNYYISQYRSSLERNADLSSSVSHQVFSLLRWSNEQRDEYLQKQGIHPEAVNALDETGQEFLCLPFFARVFAASPDMAQQGKSGQQLVKLLITRYLEREAAKLQRYQTDTSLLSAEELRSIFTEAAEMIAGRSDKLLEIDELRFITQMVIGTEDLDSRQGLNDRLTALCGLSAETTGNIRRFGFTHDLYFDHFFGKALEIHFRNGSDASRSTIRDLLGNNSLAAASLEALQERPSEILTFIQSTQSKTEPPSHNLGKLWPIALPETKSLNAISISGAQFDELSVPPEDSQTRSISIANCEIAHLSIDLSRSGSISIERSKIKNLSLDNQTDSRQPLRIHLDDESLDNLSGVESRDEIAYTDKSIAKVLHSNGVEARKLTNRLNQNSSEEAEAFEFFLRKLSLPGITLIVFVQSREPEDNRLSWHQTYGVKTWRRFLDRLESSGIADFEQMTTSGPKKIFVKLKLTPKDVLARTGSEEVENFWNLT